MVQSATDRSTAVHIDGSRGEGGGQVLRTALSLSMITGRAFVIEHIRANRSRPGLLRQHLTAVRAAAAFCDARMDGAEPGSGRLAFAPGPLEGGERAFAICTAGSTTLVAQTLIPALIGAGVEARVRLSGGTHNPHAPPADYLQRVYLPLLHRMGARIELTLHRHGFYPAGGGELELQVQPVEALSPLTLEDRGKLQRAEAEVLICALPGNIAERELNTLLIGLRWSAEQGRIKRLGDAYGPGNLVQVSIESDGLCEQFCGFGEKGIKSERVARGVARKVHEYLHLDAPVGPHLADQLMLPLVLSGGRYRTYRPSSHSLTNLATIEAFLPGRLVMRDARGGDVWVEALVNTD